MAASVEGVAEAVWPKALILTLVWMELVVRSVFL